MDGFGCGVGASAGDDLDSTHRKFHSKGNDLEVFFTTEGRGFSGGAAGHDAIDACGNLAFNEGLEGIGVDDSVTEWGDECGVGSLKHGG